MNDLELIHELDDRLEIVRNAWSDEMIKLYNNPKIEPDSREYQRQMKILSKKYSPLMAKILIARQDAFNREYKRQKNMEINAKGSSSSLEVDEFGRPKNKYWKDGEWHYYKRPWSQDNLQE